MTAPAALELRGVSSGYGSAVVVRDVSLTVPAGGIVALLGKNGVGKTTLLRTVMGFNRPVAGGVSALGEDVSRASVQARARAGVAYVPQERALFQDLSVRDNLRLGLPRDALLGRALERTRALFPFLAARLSQPAGTLSGGEQKMLLLARAFAAEPRLVLLDEVTEGLQPSVVHRLSEIVRERRAALSCAMLLVEQHVAFALGVADAYAVMKAGEIVASGEASAPDARAAVEERLAL